MAVIASTIQCDFYKTGHFPMYPPGTIKLYSNLTPRKSRFPGINKVVVFGIQYFVIEYLIRQWNLTFFSIPKEEAIRRYKRLMDYTLGRDTVRVDQFERLWDLGYIPLEIKALPEGSLCPIGVPCLTITNTVDHAFWLVNYIETILSCTVWQPMTSATIAYEYKKLLTNYAKETTGQDEYVQFQGHDFSMRGMSSLESACTSGAGHLLSFRGTDTIPSISFLESYYGANVESELVGTSVPATEHSVMCMGTKDDEIGTFKRLLELFPTGFLSVVSDTWNLWDVLKPKGICDTLREEILSRDGKLVIRPDSGDPIYIITGYLDTEVVPIHSAQREIVAYTVNATGKTIGLEEKKGVVELLWDLFGGKMNNGHGYRELEGHVGAIYGDSITLDRARAILERLKNKGFASNSIVFGIGSYTYQYNTRDTFGFAMKATYGEVVEDEIVPFEVDYVLDKVLHKREIYKAPVTDSGEKKSAKGLLWVEETHEGFKLHQQATDEQERGEKNALKTIFINGQLIREQSLSEIRNRLAKYC